MEFGARKSNKEVNIEGVRGLGRELCTSMIPGGLLWVSADIENGSHSMREMGPESPLWFF